MLKRWLSLLAALLLPFSCALAQGADDGLQGYTEDELLDMMAQLPEDGEEGAELRSWQALTGFALYHADGTPIGTVQAVDDATANILLIIDRADGTQTYLPFHEDFLVEARLKERALFLNVPPGLLEIND